MSFLQHLDDFCINFKSNTTKTMINAIIDDIIDSNLYLLNAKSYESDKIEKND